MIKNIFDKIFSFREIDEENEVITIELDNTEEITEINFNNID